MILRALAGPLRAALEDTPVVFLHGARQTGKTTLAKDLAAGDWPARYLSFDEAKVLEAATGDPEGFIDRLETPVVLDEIQRVPELFRGIKLAVDRNRHAGSFLLTGSAHLLVLPQLADSLVGRMEILTMRPLSQSEIEGRRERVIQDLFAEEPLSISLVPAEDDLVLRIVRGGYPEAVERTSSNRRRRWFEAYLTTLIQRDVRDLANIERLPELSSLLRLLAARSGSLLNLTELSRSSGVPRTTLKRYLGLLEGTFLLQQIPAWSTNLAKRVVRSPKAVLLDSGLLSHLLGVDSRRLVEDRRHLGPILESFVVGELLKLISWSEVRPRLFHFRTHGGHEVDIVLEDAAGRLVGIEVKSRATVAARDFRSLRLLAELVGDRFCRGVVLYTGASHVPFGQRFEALPISWLWQSAESL